MTSPLSVERELPHVKQIVLNLECEFRESIKRSRIAPDDVLAPVLEVMAKIPNVMAQIMMAAATDAAAEAGTATQVQEADREKRLLDVLGRLSAAGAHYRGIIEKHIKALSTEVEALKERRKTKETLRRRVMMVGGAALVGGLIVGGLSVHHVDGKRIREFQRQLDAIRGGKEDQAILERFLRGSQQNRYQLSFLVHEDENLVQNLTMIGLRAKVAEVRDELIWSGCIANGPMIVSQAGAKIATCLVEMGADIPSPGPATFLQRTYGARSR